MLESQKQKQRGFTKGMKSEASCIIKKGGLRMTTPAKELKPMKTYKDRMFRMIFSEKEKLLELYNAVSGKN